MKLEAREWFVGGGTVVGLAAVYRQRGSTPAEAILGARTAHTYYNEWKVARVRCNIFAAQVREIIAGWPCFARASVSPELTSRDTYFLKRRAELKEERRISEFHAKRRAVGSLPEYRAKGAVEIGGRFPITKPDYLSEEQLAS
jgi:hypothetical protein